MNLINEMIIKIKNDNLEKNEMMVVKVKIHEILKKKQNEILEKKLRVKMISKSENHENNLIKIHEMSQSNEVEIMIKNKILIVLSN
jgi:hypothetical protein